MLMNIMSLKAGLLCPVLLFIVSTVASVEDDGHCVWYGECNEDEYNHRQNCYYTGPARTLLEPTGLEILSRRCPHFMHNYGQDKKTCCNEAQLRTLDKNLETITTILAQCPSCLNNLIKHYCEITCSPIQSTFMNVTETKENEHPTYITGVEVFLSKQYIEGTYNSCREVIVPSIGRLALDLMCGEFGASQCSAQKWFHYLGDATNNPFIPFQITYIEGDDKVGPFIPANPEITPPCSKQMNTKTPACSCVDCEESSPVPPPASPPIKDSSYSLIFSVWLKKFKDSAIIHTENSSLPLMHKTDSSSIMIIINN